MARLLRLGNFALGLDELDQHLMGPHYESNSSTSNHEISLVLFHIRDESMKGPALMKVGPKWAIQRSAAHIVARRKTSLRICLCKSHRNFWQMRFTDDYLRGESEEYMMKYRWTLTFLAIELLV